MLKSYDVELLNAYSCNQIMHLFKLTLHSSYVDKHTKNIGCCDKACEIPGIKIFRFPSSLYYANASYFVQQLYKQTDCNPELMKQQRAKHERRQANAERRRKKVEARALKKKKQQLKLTADQDDRMFTVLTNALYKLTFYLLTSLLPYLLLQC